MNDERSISDPLSGITRAERRWLLVSSFVLIAISWGGLVPHEIDAFGLRVGSTRPSVLILLSCGVTTYFLFAYMHYYRADMAEARLRLMSAKNTAGEAGLAWLSKNIKIDGFTDERADRIRRILADGFANPISSRYAFEFHSAVLIGAGSLAAGVAWLLVSVLSA